MLLSEHLETFGIKHFDDESYWDWGGQKLSAALSEKEFKHFEKLRKPMQGNPKSADRLAFYDFIAKRDVAAVVHSTKADAICKSGEAINRKIGESKKILDIGCNSGYLTSWYAAQHPTSSVLGVDISFESVNTANRFFIDLNLGNVNAKHGTPEVVCSRQKFDCIVDSQSVYESFNRTKILKWIVQSLEDDGMFITVPQTVNHKVFEQYVKELEFCNLEVVDFESVLFNDLGTIAAYPLLVTKISKSQKSFNSEEAFKDLVSQLDKMRYKDA
jgi:2-polyprenyl-3-methyl-5-hydroxy-6-metoxy-1,4-benzoquinol methylase